MMDAAAPPLAVLEAILAWQRHPTDEARGHVRDSLGALVSASGGSGAFLDVDSATLPGLSVGWGTLAAGSVTQSARRVELHSQDGRVRTGSLWLDGAIGATGVTDATHVSDQAVRVVELALEAAAARAGARQTAERLEALDEATRGIAGLVSLDRVLQLIADRVRDLIGARYAALGIVDAFGVMERFVTSGISQQQREAIGQLPRGHGLLGLIIRENRSYRIPDIAAHASSYGFPPEHPPMQSFLGVPIQVKGRSVGNFYLTDKRNAPAFSEADQDLVEMFALHAGVAIENARLHEQVQRMAIVDERVRIGKDLHDGIIQALYGVGLSLEDVPDLMAEDAPEAAARVDRAIDSLNLTIRDIRNFIFGLRPELAELGGLVAGIAALASEFRLNSVIDVELEAAEDLPDVGEDRRAELLKMVREALSNIARHSKATRATVRVALAGDRLELVISDNGTGFSPADQRGGAHQGLANMRTRALDLAGELTIDTAAGAGTRITIRVPAFQAADATAPVQGGNR